VKRLHGQQREMDGEAAQDRGRGGRSAGNEGGGVGGVGEG
jgi:hypothetical protein